MTVIIAKIDVISFIVFHADYYHLSHTILFHIISMCNYTIITDIINIINLYVLHIYKTLLILERNIYFYYYNFYDRFICLKCIYIFIVLNYLYSTYNFTSSEIICNAILDMIALIMF